MKKAILLASFFSAAQAQAQVGEYSDHRDGRGVIEYRDPIDRDDYDHGRVYDDHRDYDRHDDHDFDWSSRRGERARLLARELEAAARHVYLSARDRTGRRLDRREQWALGELRQLIESADRLSDRLERRESRHGRSRRSVERVLADYRDAARAVHSLHSRHLERDFDRVDVLAARLARLYSR